MSKTILIVEDNEVDRKIISEICDHLGFKTAEVKDGFEALYVIKNNIYPNIGLILLDIFMPKMNGIEFMREVKPLKPDLPIIITTSSNDLNHAVEAMQLGAQDFITKPIGKERLDVSIRNVLKINSLDCELKKLRKKDNNNIHFDDLVGHDSGLSQAIKLGEKAASSDISVLITGESGSGKELFARAVHGESHRAGQPFIAVNCGAIPEKLVESILFGHEKGAFTGATGKTLGKFREASGGTIFLDEVGELSQDIQVKLLRVLQNREIEPVGLGKQLPVDVRIISATNRDLTKRVQNGDFREDLFFRLNGFPIKLPAVRDRREDVLPLADFFLDKYRTLEGKNFVDFSDSAIEKMQNYSWPGNVREIENAIYRAVLLVDGTLIHDKHIELTPMLKSIRRDDAIGLYDANGTVKKLRDIEKEIIRVLLEKFNNRVDLVAKALGIGQATIYRKKKTIPA